METVALALNSRQTWPEDPSTDAAPKPFQDFVEQVLSVIEKVDITNAQREEESSEYGALRFEFLKKKCLFRQAKTTTKKVGQFVTIWKREHAGDEIAPFDVADDVDIVVVAAHGEGQQGYFVFEKNLLGQKQIFTSGSKEGKRAIRVYAPWVKATAKQAISTQKWQVQWFVSLPVKQNRIFWQVADLFKKNSL